MIAAHRRRIEKTDREKIFIIGHPDEFPKGSPVDLISEEVNAKITEFLALDKEIDAKYGGRLQALEIKSDTRDFLVANLLDIVTGAIAIGDETVPGIAHRYRIPYPRTDENLLRVGEAWVNETAAHENHFISVGLSPEFRNHLDSARDDFRKALEIVAGMSGEHIEAFARLDAIMRDIMNLTRRRAALIKLKYYKTNHRVLASWSIASYLEPPPKRKVNIIMQIV